MCGLNFTKYSTVPIAQSSENVESEIPTAQDHCFSNNAMFRFRKRHLGRNCTILSPVSTLSGRRRTSATDLQAGLAASWPGRTPPFRRRQARFQCRPLPLALQIHSSQWVELEWFKYYYSCKKGLHRSQVAVSCSWSNNGASASSLFIKSTMTPPTKTMTVMKPNM